jgi:hypothetical protein
VESDSDDRVLGRLEAGQESLKELLQAHTEADSANFDRLEAHLLRLEAKLEPPKRNTARAAAWGTVAASVITAAAEALRRFSG